MSLRAGTWKLRSDLAVVCDPGLVTGKWTFCQEYENGFDMTDRNAFVPLRHAAVLLAIAEGGSISAAAVAIGATQSALTKALHRAEQDFGQPLFERRPRGVVPTEIGAVVLDYARLIRRHSQEALNAVDALSDVPGTIVVGAGASFLDALLPSAIARVVSKRPASRIRMKVDTVAALMESLRNGDLDLVFVSELPGISSMRDVEWTPLINNEMDIVARKGHPLVRKGAVTIEDLQGYGWVLGGETDPQQRYLSSVFRAHGTVLPEPTVETLSRPVALQIVRQSDLLSLMPNTRTYSDQSEIARVKCPMATWVRVAGIAVNRGGVLPPVGEDLVREIKSVCAEHSGALR